MPEVDSTKKMTCFAMHKENKTLCAQKSCRYWHRFQDKGCGNCTLLAARSGPFTLQEVGDIFGLTRMRICQIEKGAKQTLKTLAPDALKVL